MLIPLHCSWGLIQSDLLVGLDFGYLRLCGLVWGGFVLCLCLIVVVYSLVVFTLRGWICYEYLVCVCGFGLLFRWLF